MAGEHDPVRIDWSSATVVDGGLRVGFAEGAAKEWVTRVGEVLDRLGRPGGGWGAVDAKRKGFEVDDVQAGAETDLRHLLEGAVQQANADLAAPDEPDERGVDTEMTAVFRAFAAETEGWLRR
jgi:hypothetical protein